MRDAIAAGMRFRARLRRAACVVGVFIAVLVGAAGTASAQLCQGQFTDTNFGTINPTMGLAADSVGTFSVQCQGTANATARVCPNVNSGSGGDAGNAASRQLGNAGSNLRFSLFSDSSRTIVWGSYLWAYASQAPSPQFDIPLGPTGQATRSYSVYGRIYGGQPTAPAGTYNSNFNGVQVLVASGYTTSGNCGIISGTGGRRANFSVTASVARTCALSTTSLDFGPRAALSAVTDGSAQLRITCTSGAPYTVGLNGGASGAASPTQRKMTKGASTITYGLFGDAGRTQPWFNTNAFFQASGSGTGSSQTFTVYGRIPVQTTPPPGSYTDTVVVTVTY